MLCYFGRRALAAERRDMQRGDPVALFFQNAETESVKRKALPGFGDRTRLVNYQTGDRRRLFVRQAPVHQAIEIADRHRAVDHDGAIRLRLAAAYRNVVLVGNVTDGILQNVLE